MALGPAADERAARRIAAILGRDDGPRDELDRALVTAIRAGTIAPDDPHALDHLAIDQPRYLHELDPNLTKR
ncbi:hypothetical protein LTR94_037080 [Friedmanniomyces endolithicus]|nr:hypothetical protein LTR94_037080 [Friedmanniomyces endolithicus]